jgi:hypothetical protein
MMVPLGLSHKCVTFCVTHVVTTPVDRLPRQASVRKA